MEYDYRQFFDDILGYYGSYSNKLKAKVSWDWVIDNVPKGKLKVFFNIVTDRYSSKWKMPPDKNVFRECLGVDEDEEREISTFIKRYCTPMKIDNVKKKQITGGLT